MIERYSRKELKDIWSEENKYKIWLEVEIAAAEAMEKFKIIPKYCFSCYKIQINLKTVVDLIKLFLIFDKIKLEKNNTRKCIVEIRNKIKGN